MKMVSVGVLLGLQCLVILCAVSNSQSDNNITAICLEIKNETACCTENCTWCFNETATDGKCQPLNHTEKCQDACKGNSTQTTTTHASPTTQTTEKSNATSSISTAMPTTAFDNSTSTSSPTGSSSGSTPPTTTPATPAPHYSSFSAGSFVGGIVLGLGLCGIVFFAYRCYVSKHRPSAPYQQF